jgi:hypothetical protein
MALRQVKDASGREWMVWDTHPASADVRVEYATGWLSFRCQAETRRVAPPPAEWFALPDDALLELLQNATVSGPRQTGT